MMENLYAGEEGSGSPMGDEGRNGSESFEERLVTGRLGSSEGGGQGEEELEAE